jgi:sensor histidine kinase YesM
MRTLLLGVLIAGPLGAVFGAAVYALSQNFPIMQPADNPLRLEKMIAFGFTYGQLHFGIWALAFVFPFAMEDARIRALEADKLRLEAEKLRSSAELARLRQHLEPHFLLNTLNAIAGLVTEEPREARRLLACLGDLLRDALRDGDEMQTLDEQVAWLQRYAAILEARHPKDLVFRWEIDGETRDALVPRMLLQPLVENAVKHGALRRRGGGEVVLRTTMSNGAGDATVVCTIEDNGPGVHERESRPGAIGLRAVQQRLDLNYEGRAKLRLESGEGGTRSIVELPRLTTRPGAQAQAAGGAS